MADQLAPALEPRGAADREAGIGGRLDGRIRPSGDRPRLLLIDDEPFVARFLAHAAEDIGYAAQITISADNFRRAYDAERPDIIAIDLAMPGCDGIELLRFLAERKSDAIIMIVSGFDQRVLDAAMRFGDELGLRMAGPLHKPLMVDDLKAAIATAPPRREG